MSRKPRKPGRPKGRRVTAKLTIAVEPERLAGWRQAQRKKGGKAVRFYANAIDEWCERNR